MSCRVCGSFLCVCLQTYPDPPAQTCDCDPCPRCGSPTAFDGYCPDCGAEVYKRRIRELIREGMTAAREGRVMAHEDVMKRIKGRLDMDDVTDEACPFCGAAFPERAEATLTFVFPREFLIALNAQFFQQGVADKERLEDWIRGVVAERQERMLLNYRAGREDKRKSKKPDDFKGVRDPR